MVCTAVEAVNDEKEQKIHSQESIELNIQLAGINVEKGLSHSPVEVLT